MTRSSSQRKSLRLPARSGEDRLLAGVCATLARELAIDVTLLRLAFSLASFAWGIGLLVYGALWLILPPAGAEAHRGMHGMRGTVRLNVQNMGAEVSASARTVSRAWQNLDHSRWPRPLDRRWIAIGLIAAGAFVLLSSLGAFSWLTPTRGLGFAVIILGTAILLRMRGEH